MGNLRSTVIMKTDIRGFTTRVGMLSGLELSNLLKSHKFVVEIAASSQSGLRRDGLKAARRKK